MSEYELQSRVMHQSNVMRDTIKGLHEWEKEMKQKEAQRIASNITESFEQSQPIRSVVQQQQQPTTSSTKIDDEIKPKVVTAPPSLIEKANEFKTRGNDCVKNGQYEKAIRYYTEAIRLNKTEAVYYTNRALCYLKQNKFNECIDDCTVAIQLDDKAVKAYYRRMQAQEQMENGDFVAALKDCETVLKLEPKNVDAKRGLDRIKAQLHSSKSNEEIKRIDTKIIEKERKENEQINWSQFENNNNYEKIDFISKAPHLRSKQPLKRIFINDGSVKKQKINVNAINSKDNDDEVATKHLVNESDKKSVIEQSSQPVQSFKLEIPKTTAQFYKTWSSLKNVEHKFQLLKGISNSDVRKLFGAQLNLNIVREIFSILQSHFLPAKLPMINIMTGIIYNSETQIIAVMMNDNDKKVLYNLLESMASNGENEKKTEIIKTTFDNYLLAM